MKNLDLDMAPLEANETAVNDTAITSRLIKEVKLLAFEIKVTKMEENSRISEFMRRVSEDLKEVLMELGEEYEEYDTILEKLTMFLGNRLEEERKRMKEREMEQRAIAAERKLELFESEKKKEGEEKLKLMVERLSKQVEGMKGRRKVLDKSKIRCFKCSEYGHFESECTRMNKSEQFYRAP